MDAGINIVFAKVKEEPIVKESPLVNGCAEANWKEMSLRSGLDYVPEIVFIVGIGSVH